MVLDCISVCFVITGKSNFCTNQKHLAEFGIATTKKGMSMLYNYID